MHLKKLFARRSTEDKIDGHGTIAPHSEGRRRRRSRNIIAAEPPDLTGLDGIWSPAPTTRDELARVDTVFSRPAEDPNLPTARLGEPQVNATLHDSRKARRTDEIG